jgi:hypothetical protein
MSLRRQGLRGLALLAVIPLGLGLAGVRSAAAASPLGLSWDGRIWSASLTGQLLNAPRLEVPGDTASGRFFVRNLGPSAAMLRVAYRLPQSAAIGPKDLQLTARVGSGTWTPLADGNRWLLVATTALDRGLMVPVDVRANFNPRSDNTSQHLVEPITFRVTLSGNVPAAATPSASSSHGATATGGGGLAMTGAQAGLMLIAGAVLVGAGFALFTGGRLFRRRGEHHG